MATDFSVRTNDNGTYLKLSCKEDDKWNTVFMPQWVWLKFKDVIPQVDQHLNNKMSCKPLDITKIYKVEVLFKSGVHTPSLFQLDRDQNVKSRLSFSKKQWEEFLSKSQDITRDFQAGKSQSVKRSRVEEEEEDLQKPPAKITLYAHRVHDSRGVLQASSEYRYLSVEACAADIDVGDDCNMEIKSMETEMPSPYELSKLVMCALVERNMNGVSDSGMLLPAMNAVTRTVMRQAVKSVLTKVEFECSNRLASNAVDVVHAMLGKDQIADIIHNRQPLYKLVKAYVESCDIAS